MDDLHDSMSVVCEGDIYKIENSDEIMYVAQYVYQDVQYIFNATTTLPEEEIEKILKNIKIF